MTAESRDTTTLAVPASDRDKAKANWEAYTRLRDQGHLKYVDEAKKFDNYYRGEQWDLETQQRLNNEGRPYLTINLVLSTVNAVIGQYIRTRQQVHFKPAGSGANEALAFILNQIVAHIDEMNGSRWNEKTMFEDGLVLERGYLDLRMDYSTNALGDAKESVLDPMSVIPDASAQDYDPDTWSQVIVSRWMTVDDIEALYGKEKADAVFHRQSPSEEFGADSLEWLNNTYGDTSESVEYSDTPTEDRRISKVRLVDRQYRKLVRRRYFLDDVTGDIAPAPDGWDADRVEAHALEYDLYVSERVERRIRWTISACDVLLFDNWSPYKHFTVVPYFPYFRRGKPFGMIRNLLSPQDLLNKMTSQELHVINTSANSGWIVEAGSLINMDVADLERDGSKTGLVLEFSKGAQPPDKIQPNQVPTGLDRMADKANMLFPQISGVNQSMLGIERRAEVSGVAMQRRQEGGMLQLEVVFDNLEKTRQIRARHLLDMVQGFYTEPRVMAINAQDEDGREMVEELAVNQPVGGRIEHDLTMGKYSIRIDTVPEQRTIDEVNFQQLLSMRESGMMVPDWAIFESSPLPNKRELAEWSRRMSGALEPTPEEIEKAQQMEEMQMRMLVAQIDEQIAKARERMANTQLLMVKAEKEAGQQDHEMQLLGAQIRADIEKQMIELQQNREDLMLRMRVAQGKEAVVAEGNKIGSLTSRINEAVKAQTAIGVAELAAKNRAAASPAKKSGGRK